MIRPPEFEDFPWLPRALRNGITDYLSFILRIGQFYEPALPLLDGVIGRLRERRILDCCSGGGGPWLSLYPKMAARYPGLVIQWSDFFPNAGVAQRLKAVFDGHGSYLDQSIDARNIPAEVRGLRTFFSCFHHFSPADARRILRDAVDKGTGIAVFEATQRSVLAILWMIFLVPWVVLLVTPWIRPFSWSRFLLTYVVPVLPLLIAWDGFASCLRTYSCEELRALAASVGGDYDWIVGEVRGRFSPVPITYLLGTPRR